MNRCRGSTILSKRCRRILPNGQYYCPTHSEQEQYILIFDSKDENMEKRFQVKSKTRRLPETEDNHFIIKQTAARDKYIAFIFDQDQFINTQLWTKLRNPGWVNQNNRYMNKDKVAVVIAV